MPEESTNAADTEQAGGEPRKESGWAAQSAGQSSSEGNGGGSESGASRQKNLERPTAEDIYEQVSLNAKTELKRSTTSLAISGYAGGIFMGLSGLGTALVLGLFGTSNMTHFIAMMFYPIGFIVVIIGRAQLFTENTLYPVALVLAEKRELLNTMRLWCTVLPANVLGALTFAALAARTSA
jgi:formate/nitrite transporter FocA (FNT family)